MPFWRWEYNAIVNSLNDLKQWIDSKVSFIPIRNIINQQQITIDMTTQRQVIVINGPGILLLYSDGSGDSLLNLLVNIDGIKQLNLMLNEKWLYAFVFASGIKIDLYNPWAESKTSTISNIIILGLAQSIKSIDNTLVNSYTGEIRLM